MSLVSLFFVSSLLVCNQYMQPIRGLQANFAIIFIADNIKA
ncbi:hypothetical protein EE09_31 [Escherichia phage vB_EcoS-EE09]|nr:hypothetical protein EE09_31 [Escherichia phage vB_EcoS-EE09]